MGDYSVPAAGTCDECGFDWSVGALGAVDQVSAAARRINPLLAGRDGSAKSAPQVWSPNGYVAHLADTVMSWAERAWAVRQDPSAPLVPYDQDELAAVRGYDSLPQAGVLWALERAADAWAQALLGADLPLVVRHPEYADGSTLADVARQIAHEVHHHEMDVRRGLGLA